MRPHVICHMTSSLDGRILADRWAPKDLDLHGVYERLHEQIGGDAWLVGRVTGQELAKAGAYPELTVPPLPREPWFAGKNAASYAIVLDGDGKIAWGRADIGGDPIVVVLMALSI